MIEAETFVRDWPEAPATVSLAQAVGLLKGLTRPETPEALMQRLRIDDPVIRLWALDALLGGSARIEGELLQVAMTLAPRSAYLRRLLTPHFLGAFRFDLLEALERMEAEAGPRDGALHGALLQAVLHEDHAAQVALHEALYMLGGDARHIMQARMIARNRLPWREAMPVLLRAMFTHAEPLADGLLSSLQMLERENARAPFRALAQVIGPGEEMRFVMIFAAAQIAFWNGDYDACIAALGVAGTVGIASDRNALLSSLMARAKEKSGRYTEAAEWYDRQNTLAREEQYDPASFIAGLETRAGWPIPALPADERRDHFIMTGFPRSGTTLLENALASHPDVITCEETSSLIGSINTAYRMPLPQTPEARRQELRALVHRQLYYRNLERFVPRGAAPRVVIDKTPIMSANIRYLEKLFPDKRYVFSIRHPYDVVLSNWKQYYAQNSAMSAFNDIHDACVLYDHVMRDWFDVFPGETDRVHYIRYDALVTDFEPSIRGVLDFLGVGWVDEVKNFAETAASRAVRTPSYANVRQGLSLGVQSSWRDFAFLFDERCRALLDPWAARFDYDTGV